MPALRLVHLLLLRLLRRCDKVVSSYLLPIEGEERPDSRNSAFVNPALCSLAESAGLDQRAALPTPPRDRRRLAPSSLVHVPAAPQEARSSTATQAEHRRRCARGHHAELAGARHSVGDPALLAFVGPRSRLIKRGKISVDGRVITVETTRLRARHEGRARYPRAPDPRVARKRSSATPSTFRRLPRRRRRPASRISTVPFDPEGMGASIAQQAQRNA